MLRDDSLGEIKILFGTVVDLKDDLKINRARVSIKGLTDEIKQEELPWYFPFYGIDYLPILKDEVPVIIFDNNIVTGFYGNKIDLKKSNLQSVSEDDYENYLEVFRRSIDDKNVQITYEKSKGIQFINGESFIQTELEKISLFKKAMGVKIEEKEIHIGDDGFEANLMGDKTVKELKAIIKHQSTMLTELITLFTKISSACTNPFTLGIAAQIASGVPLMQSKLVKENTQINLDADKIQSKKIFTS